MWRATQGERGLVRAFGLHGFERWRGEKQRERVCQGAGAVVARSTAAHKSTERVVLN